jgi:hypothetical protein
MAFLSRCGSTRVFIADLLLMTQDITADHLNRSYAIIHNLAIFVVHYTSRNACGWRFLARRAAFIGDAFIRPVRCGV